MEHPGNVVLLDAAEIIAVVCRTLSKIDPRLVDHGERVAFIADRIRGASPDCEQIDRTMLFVLCLLHDIGAYKTDEIDDMVRFETVRSFDHSVYGYLFVRNAGRLAAYAEAILYHHTDYSQMTEKHCAVARYAELIHLADRADILLQASDCDLNVLSSLAGTRFNPTYVTALLRVEEGRGISDPLLTGAYRDENRVTMRGLEIYSSDIMDYLRLLVFAIDFRSPYTVTHTADTTLISMEAGKLLGLDDRALQVLYIGAFLHDIGKIAIPQSILEKPGKLTLEEYTFVQRHIPEGEEVLRGVVSDEICDIALRHHEKLDGSGYSCHLRAEALTVPQRVVAVADILSALSQRRSYKEPFAKEKTLSILQAMKRHGQLCPLVVDTVCDHYDLILSNTEKSHDPVRTMYADLKREYAVRIAAR